MSALVVAEIWVKHENHQPVGAFKVRGGVNLLSQLTEDERQRGITDTISTTRANTANAKAIKHGYRYVHSGNEPLLIAGVATETLEILEDEPTIDTVIVPIGGGSGAAGACIVAKAMGSSVQVVGVQSQAAQPPIAPGKRASRSKTRWKPSLKDSPPALRSSSHNESSRTSSTISY